MLQTYQHILLQHAPVFLESLCAQISGGPILACMRSFRDGAEHKHAVDLRVRLQSTQGKRHKRQGTCTSKLLLDYELEAERHNSRTGWS